MAAVSVSIIGSFRQYYSQATLAVKEFESLGVNVRSPVVSRIVNPGDEFARFETDPPQSSDQFTSWRPEDTSAGPPVTNLAACMSVQSRSISPRHRGICR
jgi:hypothetical protein